MIATRVKEFIHFGIVPFNTIRDGRVYFFVAVDAYTKYAFNLGVDKKMDDDVLLKYVDILMRSSDFKRLNGTFMLIMPAGEHLKELINVLIAPSGKVVFNEELALKEILPLLKEFV